MSAIFKATEAARDAKAALTPPVAPPGRPPPPPVIPTSWLEPHEQRFAFLSVFGLIQCVKVWDIFATYVSLNPEPTWSSALRVQSGVSAAGWAVFELSIFYGLALLRIPRLSPTGGRLVQLGALLVVWNLLCWMVAAPGSFLVKINMFGPPALGVQWYLSWWPLAKRAVWGEEGNISGVHRVRLLPFSTATLNPLSLTYCIPPNADSPVYIPIVFNNSAPDEVAYFVRSLETGHAELKTVAGSTLKRPSAKPLTVTDNDDDDDLDIDDAPEPLTMVLSSAPGLDLARLPSVRPADSLALVPKKLAHSEHMLFVAVDRPAVVTLKTVSDRRGDRFHIAPQREAVVVECPYGGDFVTGTEGAGGVVKKGNKRVVAEQRCVGDAEVLQFQVRGVGAMKVGWKKRSSKGTQAGVIEGIEGDVDEVVDGTGEVDAGQGTLALVRRDKVARTHTVPLKIEHDAAGVYTVSLTSVSDSLYNSYTPSGPSSEWSFDVQSRPFARFDCPRPIQLLLNRTASIPVIIGSHDDLSGLGEVQVAYEYTLSNGAIGGDTLKTNGRRAAVQVAHAGVYTLTDASARCGGRIIEPSICRVEVIPTPTVNTGVKTLHECAMDVGVTVSFDFTGAPPFVVEYSESRNGGRAQARRQAFQSMHGEIVLLPDNEGEYTYTLDSLSDKHYQRLPISHAPITQTIHPLANVDLAMPAQQRAQRLHACSGDSVTLEVEAKGRAPLSLNYHVTSGGASENHTASIAPGRSKITVPVPPHLAAGSGAKGRFGVSLLAITDGNGCTRRLSPAPSYEVDVDRQKPTARLAQRGKAVIINSKTAAAALRLTGTAPWHVTYVGTDGVERKITTRDANAELVLSNEGAYQLVSVRDSHCPGDIVDQEATFEVAFKPQPNAYIVRSPALREENGGLVHRGLCEEEEDQVAFRFEGEGPFELVYRHTRAGTTSRHILKSAQNTGILHLSTEPGSHRYDTVEMRDSNYAVDLTLSVSHDVNSRPSVTFAKPNTRVLCLDAALKSDARLRFEGKAPFDVQLSVRAPGSGRVETFDVRSEGDEWALDLPGYVVKESGRHEVGVLKMRDAGGCEWVVNERDRLGVGVDVVESARIVPAPGTTEARDLCVGETIEFELQGTAPWSVEYEWLGRSHRVTSSTSRFSRYAEAKGEFRVKSVALKDDQCKREVADLVRHVHPLPSVRVQEGLNELREGDAPAAFSVQFTGTPPFAFTYTRSESGGERRAKVLETQTVSDIWTDEYTISSSLPGDYQVVSVSDRYCRYPPLKGRKGV